MPFEVTKTRVQLGEGATTGMLDNMRSTVRTGGLRALYYGMPITLIQTAGKVGIRFAVYERAKARLQHPDGTLTPVRQVFAGMLAGSAEAVLWITPCERLKTLRQTQIGVRDQVFTTWSSSLQIIVRQQGVPGLWRGLTPTLLRNAMASGMRFIIYDCALAQLRRTNSQREGRGWHPIAAGAAAGALTTVFNNPLDVVKSLMQAEGAQGRQGNPNSLQCVRNILRTEGALGLMRGLAPRLVKITMGQAVIFAVYDRCMRLLP